jgi:outer membrane autotransporter protein
VDFLVGQGFAAALAPENARPGLHVFAVLGGGNLRHKTGSHVDVDGVTLITGVTATRTTSAGNLTLGTFFEHGEGDYSTHTRSSANGRGDVDYNGGGLLAHLEFNETPRGHFYAEATARAGLVDLDFKSDPAGTYESRTDYESAHVGLGYVAKLDDSSALKLYGQVLWSHQGSDTVKLRDGESVKLKTIDSRRTRLGARWSQTVLPGGQLYLGAAWEREYDGKAKVSIFGDRLTTPKSAPKLTGNTTLVEAGFTLTPVKSLTLEFGVQGHTGRREGVTGSFKVEYRF